MATNTRIRLEPDIEDYLRNQAQRVIGKSGENVSGAELTTITNRLLYEHKLAQTMVRHDNTDSSFSLIDNGETLEMPETLLSQCRESATWNELEAQFLQAGGNISVSNTQEIDWSDWALEEWLV